MKFKNYIAVITMVCMCASLVGGCRPSSSSSSGSQESAGGDTAQGEAGDSSEETYTFQVGHVVTTDHSYHLGLQKFAESVNEKTGGRVNIEIFPSGQLGNEADLTEGVTMGTIDMALVNSGNLASFVDSYQLFDLPFLFRDNAHAHAVLDGEIGQQALQSLEGIGIKGFANWENGFFCTWNKKNAINSSADFSGLKIRANNNPIHIDAYNALGVSAITMGWSEVYTAIQNGTVDGVSVSIPSMYTAKIQEVAPYISTSSEFYVTVILMMNLDLFNSLPSDIQQALIEAAQETTDYQRKLNGEMTDEYIQALKDEGYEVTEPDLEELKAACWDAVYDKYAAQLGEDKIKSIMEDY